MSLNLRLRPSICLISLILCLTLFCNASWARPDPAPMSPAELHRILAEGKIRASEGAADVKRVPPSVVDVSGYDATYYRIQLDIDQVNKQVVGEVTMRARAQTDNYTSPTIYLRDELIIDSICAGGMRASYSRSDPFVYVTLDQPYDTGEEFEIITWYHGQPTTGGLMGFNFGSYQGIPVVSTLSEPYMAQSWWPCKDTPSDKADSADIIVTVNSDFYAVSNGVLRDSIDNGNGTTTYSWHEGYPITTYLISLVITELERFTLWYYHGSGDADSMPVCFYSYPPHIDDALMYWPITVDQIGFFAEIFGEYPFLNEKYGMAHFNWGGAMEHQTVTSATPGSFGFNQYLIAHELAHQWFGDLITCRNWHHIWMNEGFASYSEALWAEYNGGATALRDYMDGMRYYGGGRIYIDDTTDVWNIFSTRVYDKGAWVLHMLRGAIGDSAFFALLKEYASHPDHFHKDVVTEEFRDLAEAVSGVELDEFFQDWIYGYYYPRYYWSWTSEPYVANFHRVYVHIRQAQTGTPQVFDMPIQLRFNGVGGTPVNTVWNTMREQDYMFEFPDMPSSISFDPDKWILTYATQESYGLNLINNGLASGTQFLPYHDSLIAKGGTPPYEFTVASGSLPQGLTLHTATGVIDGAPLSSGTATVTIGVWDAGHANYKQKSVTLDIGAMAYMPGDQNGDLVLDPLDLNALIDYIFASGPPPEPLNAADLNADCQPDALDMSTLIDHLYANGPLPLPGCIE